MKSGAIRFYDREFFDRVSWTKNKSNHSGQSAKDTDNPENVCDRLMIAYTIGFSFISFGWETDATFSKQTLNVVKPNKRKGDLHSTLEGKSPYPCRWTVAKQQLYISREVKPEQPIEKWTFIKWVTNYSFVAWNWYILLKFYIFVTKKMPFQPYS